MTPQFTQYFILAMGTQSYQKTFQNLSALKADLKLWRIPGCGGLIGLKLNNHTMWIFTALVSFADCV